MNARRPNPTRARLLPGAGGRAVAGTARARKAAGVPACGGALVFPVHMCRPPAGVSPLRRVVFAGFGLQASATSTIPN